MAASAKVLKVWLSMFAKDIEKLERELEAKRKRYASLEKQLASIPETKARVAAKVEVARSRRKNVTD